MGTDCEKVVVTGGAGFIGSHLVERLLAEGKRVVVIDDFSTGSKKNLRHLRSHPRLAVKEGEVSNLKSFASAVKGSSFVFHLAAAVGVELVVRSPIRTMETNLRETERVLEVAAENQVPVLITSTSEVYGKSGKALFKEDDDLLIGPPYLGRWSYACSKLMDEFLALAYAREKKAPVIVARLFNTVGPRQTGRYGMVLPRFIKSALAGEDLVVHGDGAQTRCFCYVADTVEALLRLSRSPASLGEIVNIGSQQEISILALAERVIQILGATSRIRLISYDQAYESGFQDMRRRKPSIQKLKKLTGYQPLTPLDEIIRRTAAGLG